MACLQRSTHQDTAYRVGPGFPPREHQFKPGHSGNPDGAQKRPPSIAPDLKALLQAALSKKVTLTIGDKERVLTKAAAGIEQLVDQFARGDRYARRDLFDLADKLGLDLGASSRAALEELAGKALSERRCGIKAPSRSLIRYRPSKRQAAAPQFPRTIAQPARFGPKKLPGRVANGICYPS